MGVGVAVFYRKAKNFANEELRLHSPTIISFQLVTGRRRWNIVECYIACSDASTTEDVVSAIMYQTYEAELLIAGNLNTKLEDPEVTPRAEAIADELMASGLMDMGLHFLPRRKMWLKDMCTWRMQWDRQEVWSQTATSWNNLQFVPIM